MSKIIYGVSGEGSGHATRSREILSHLVAQGHQVLVMTYGRGLFFLEKEFPTVAISGLFLIYKDNKLVYWRTIYKNAKQMFKQSREWHNNLVEFRKFNPDLVITDFEPTTALLAKVQRVPLISIDNQHQITNTKIRLPLRYKNDLVTDKLIIKSMVWGAEYYLVTTFFQTPIKSENTFLFPPILRKEILDLKPNKKDFILVYQNSDFDHIIKTLFDFKEENFVVFGSGRKGKENNVEFKEYSYDEWLDYLKNCKAIIGTAGLSLITESLHLSKPYLAVPIKKQVEQIINAVYLEKMGYGIFCRKFSKRVLADFLKRLSEIEKNLKRYKKTDNHRILDKIDKIIKELV